MKVDDEGVKLTEGFEGLRLDAYQDSVGVWTIGYGHTKGVKEGMVITQEQAEDFLRQDMAEAVQAVTNLVHVPLSQSQFDALVDFTFNLGTGALQGSTLLKLLNNGNYAGAGAEFVKWDHAGGKVLSGLLKRRQAEATMFRPTSPNTSQPTIPAPVQNPALPPNTGHGITWILTDLAQIVSTIFGGSNAQTSKSSS